MNRTFFRRDAAVRVAHSSHATRGRPVVCRGLPWQPQGKAASVVDKPTGPASTDISVAISIVTTGLAISAVSASHLLPSYSRTRVRAGVRQSEPGGPWPKKGGQISRGHAGAHHDPPRRPSCALGPSCALPTLREPVRRDWEAPQFL